METKIEIIPSSIIVNYIENRIIKCDLPLESKVHMVFRRCLQTGGMLVIIGSRIATAMICLKGATVLMERPLTDPITLTLGISNVIGVTISHGLFSAFNTLNAIEEFMKPLTTEEKQITAKILPSWKKTLIKTIAVVTGLIAQFPISYAAYETAFFLPIFAFLTIQLDFGRGIYSTYLSLMHLTSMDKNFYMGTEIPLVLFQKYFVEQLERRREALAINCNERKLLLETLQRLLPRLTHGQIDKIRQKLLQKQEKEEENIIGEQEEKNCETFLKHLFAFYVPMQNGAGPFSDEMTFRIETIALLMSIAVLAEHWQLGGAGAGYIIESPFFSTLSSILVVASSGYIWDSLIHKATHYATEFFRGTTPPSLTQEMMPRFYKRFTKLGLIAGLLTFVPQMYFAKIYFPRWAYYPIGIISSLGIIFASISAAHGIRDRIISKFAYKQENYHQIIDLDNELQKLIELVKKAAPIEIGHFLLNLSDSFLTTLKAPSKEVIRGSLASLENASH